MEINTVEDVRKALLGTVIRVEADGPFGDFTLYYSDGRVVTIDCGYVGAKLFVQGADE